MVEQVYARVVDAYPDVEPWLAQYEIVGGDDLIDKLAQGMDEADKFFIFISEQSVDKPWVRAELRRALMAEIDGVKPEYIVPIKVGQVDRFPPFIESKFYIDLEDKTEAEWLAEMHAAIRGKPTAGPTTRKNLQVSTYPVEDDPAAIAVWFDAAYWAEPISFRIRTTAPIVERQYRLIPPQRGGTLSVATREEDHLYAVALQHHRISPSQQFVMMLKFAGDTDLSTAIARVDRWDGSGATKSGFSFLSG